jgi:hypothetical protein
VTCTDKTMPEFVQLWTTMLADTEAGTDVDRDLRP